jgi:adenylate kinase
MRLIIMGAPGAGKGTHADLITKKLSIPHISTGDIFRSNIKNVTPLGIVAKEYTDKGLLVPDEITIGIVKNRLMEDDCKEGFLLDGFPRTIPQAEYLDKALAEMNIKLDHVINLNVSDDAVVQRISSRRVCSKCGAIYNTVNSPPKVEGICDVCQSVLIQREDDSEATVRDRLNVYHMQTEPLVKYYSEKGIVLEIPDVDDIKGKTKIIFGLLGIEQ